MSHSGQILQELAGIRDELGATIILITHDMGVIAQIADRVAVMYAGKIAELGTVNSIFETPLHPYSQGLIGSIPRESAQRVEGLPGEAPSPWKYPSGCRFHPRCPHVFAPCSERIPDLKPQDAERWTACHLYETEIAANA